MIVQEEEGLGWGESEDSASRKVEAASRAKALVKFNKHNRNDKKIFFGTVTLTEPLYRFYTLREIVQPT